MQDPASENWKAEIRDRGKRRKVKEARQKKHYLLCDRILGKAQPWEAGPSGLDCRGSRRELASPKLVAAAQLYVFIKIPA